MHDIRKAADSSTKLTAQLQRSAKLPLPPLHPRPSLTVPPCAPCPWPAPPPAGSAPPSTPQRRATPPQWTPRSPVDRGRRRPCPPQRPSCPPPRLLPPPPPHHRRRPCLRRLLPAAHAIPPLCQPECSAPGAAWRPTWRRGSTRDGISTLQSAASTTTGSPVQCEESQTGRCERLQTRVHARRALQLIAMSTCLVVWTRSGTAMTHGSPPSPMCSMPRATCHARARPPHLSVSQRPSGHASPAAPSALPGGARTRRSTAACGTGCMRREQGNELKEQQEVAAAGLRVAAQSSGGVLCDGQRCCHDRAGAAQGAGGSSG